MTFDLTPQNTDLLEYIDKAYELSTAGNIGMPKLALKTSNSNECKEGTFDVNHFALKTNKLIDLGKEVVACVASFRALALDWSNSDKVIATADYKSEEFNRIKAIAESGKKDTKTLFGPEFLLYLPSEKKYCTLLMSNYNSKTKGCDGFLKYMKEGKPVVIRACKAENKKGISFFPIAEKYTAEVDMSGTTKEEWANKILDFHAISQPAVAVASDGR